LSTFAPHLGPLGGVTFKGKQKNPKAKQKRQVEILQN
jgi:hypothetical protein